MKPNPGRIVLYRLTAEDVESINRRRDDFNRTMAGDPENKHPAWVPGAVAHYGNRVSVGDYWPMIIVRRWTDEFGPGEHGVNGQVILDGSDTLWVTSVKQGDGNGTWTWPVREE